MPGSTYLGITFETLCLLVIVSATIHDIQTTRSARAETKAKAKAKAQSNAKAQSKTKAKAQSPLPPRPPPPTARRPSAQ
ncbi:hypothetical protein MMC13_008166, partial [Lambiella insularis]|nr:hypothetical protein [Lambiella insularis]